MKWVTALQVSASPKGPAAKHKTENTPEKEGEQAKNRELATGTT